MKAASRPPTAHHDPKPLGIELALRFGAVRERTEALCAPLGPEDMAVQSMADASPVKWHLAHTSWFFETFVLRPSMPGYEPLAAEYALLFNSYYETVGKQFDRPRRGLLTRPSVDEVREYRAHVERWMARLFERWDGALPSELAEVVELGLQHEQQHQELILTDVLHLFSCNPLLPIYRERAGGPAGGELSGLTWTAFDGGLREIGHEGPGFAFDNERPRHKRWLEAFELADRPVCEGEFAAFVADGGYERPELWLSDGWTAVRERGWNAPLHWHREPDGWRCFGLRGDGPLVAARPVAHLSYFEADAFARWAGARLPSEAEWELAAVAAGPEGAFAEDELLEPRPLEPKHPPRARMLGDVWEWTASAYEPYPGYRAPAGALGEYNGKFMCSQLVLRGGSCATARSHVRATYRNFFYPHQRWQFSGLRLARDAR